MSVKLKSILISLISFLSIVLFTFIISNFLISKDANLKMFTFIFLLLLLIIVIAAVCLFNKLLLKRIKYINDFIDEVSETKELNKRLYISGNDEITNIANSINKMLSSLDCAHRDIISLSYSDKLTGLKNRFYIKHESQRLINTLNMDYSILIIDINGLKHINDTYGHKQGDRLIYTLANILRKSCLPDDTIARWGDGEFIILISNKNKQYLLNLMYNIESKCKENRNFNFEISIAMQSADKNEAANLESVINLAEKKLFRSKLTNKQSSKNATIKALEETLYEKDRETEEHTFRIDKLSERLGRKLNLSQDELNELKLLSLLHDIGKIGIPDNILSKPCKLTNEEWKIMKSHSEIGYRIANATPELKHVANEILCHHERFDGTGYPNGLQGEQIPVFSRIIAIVDSFDVITHKRAYKDAFDINYAIYELERCSGTQFDPYFVNKFIEILKEKNAA